MKASPLLCTVALVATAGFQTYAQAPASATPRPQPPPGPLLNATPDFSAWIITQYTVPGSRSQTAEVVAASITAHSKADSATVVTKTGAVRHRLRKLKTGEQEDIWYEHGNRLTMQSIWKMPIFEAATSGAHLPQGPDFPEFAWVSAKNFVGQQDYQGASYLIFEMQVTQGDERLAKEYGNKLTQTSNRGYINADTRLPWMLQIGDSVQRYSFQAAPTVPIEAPAELQVLFDTYEKKKAEPLRRPAAP